MSHDLRRLLANTGYLLSSRGIVLAARAVYAVALARWLGPELYGLYNYGLSWYLSFMPLAFWGISLILSRELGSLAAAKEGHDPAASHRVLSGLFSTRVITSLLTAIACLSVGLMLEAEPQTRMLLSIFAAALVGRSLAIWCSEVFVAQERADITFRLQSGMRLSEVALGCLLLSKGYGLFPIVILHLCSWWLEAVLGLALLRRGRWRFAWFGNVGSTFAYLKEAAPLTMMDLASTWMLTGPVVLFRHLYDDRATLGQLTFALQIFFMLTNLVAAFAIAVLPQMARARAENPDHGQDLVQAGYKAGFLFAALSIAAGMPLAQPVVDLLLTNAYEQTAGLLVTALWLLVPVATAAGLQQQLIADGRDRHVLLSNLLGAISMTLMMPMAIEYYGGRGAIGAAGAGLLLTMMYQLLLMTRSEPLRWLRDTVACVFMLALGCVPTFWVAPSNHWLAAIAGSAVVLVVFLMLVLTKPQRTTLFEKFRARITAHQ